MKYVFTGANQGVNGSAQKAMRQSRKNPAKHLLIKAFLGRSGLQLLAISSSLLDDDPPLPAGLDLRGVLKLFGIAFLE
jgi:hypothetical protein